MPTSTNSRSDAPSSVVLRELGGLGLEIDGQWTSVSGPRASILLAALALAGRSEVGTEQLVETIWPSPGQPATARQSLANIVLRVRKSFGDSFIESTRRGYRLGDHVESDRERFLAEVDDAGELVAIAPDRAADLIERAFTRWRGDPWLGIERPVEVEADRSHLLRAHRGALRVGATALIALERGDRAVPLLREVLEADPDDERARYQLVRILADTGQRAEALREIREAHRAFSERGLSVDAALIHVEQRLLSDAFMSDTEMEPLPVQPTDFVGRAREITDIADALRAGRLVTVHGPGGSGKTRLAVHAVSTLPDRSSSGFVDLAGTRSRSQVETAFARGLGLPLKRLDGLDADQRIRALADAAAASTGVLVVDNCEHVVVDVRTVVVEVLARAGQLRMVATSRVPLDVAGEYRYPIPRFEHAAELFRRQSASRGTPLAADQPVTAVARLCELVDHLPLAVEIAAAQTPYRTLHEITEELKHGIAHRDRAQADPRHETMAAAIRWSHELLDPDVADAFVRLGVLANPFRENDAAAVTGANDTSSVLATLVRHSLVERSDHNGRSMYRLAVPVQQYCAAELDRLGARTEVLLAFADWMLDFTDRPYGDVWWRRSVIDEIHSRFAHALVAVGALRDVERIDDATQLASRLAGAAHNFGQAAELIDLLTELWPTCTDTGATADALLALVECADATRRIKVHGSALGMLDALEGPAGRRHRAYVHCRHALWIMIAERLTSQNYTAAKDHLRLAREHVESVTPSISRAQIEMWQSGVDLFSGNWVGAEAAARRSLEHALGTTFELFATSSLCHVQLQLGDPVAAHELATSRSDLLNHATPHGEILGIVAALARVQSGDITAGLADMVGIQRRARSAHFAIQQDDVAIAIAYIAHLLHHDDLTVRILETGTIGYGPWIGYLVPAMCRNLGIPVTGHGHYGKSVEERDELSRQYGAIASEVLDQILTRQASA